MKLYTCFRCNHQTNNKNDMRKHLYKRKKDCPACSITNDIELTDEIKEYILKNREYFLPKEKKESKTTINNNNTVINNYIMDTDVIEKIMNLITYNKVKLKTPEATIYRKYIMDIERLTEGHKDILYNSNDFVKIIDKITNFKLENGLNHFNIVYDASSNKLKLYEGNKIWLEEIIEIGINKIVELIHLNYLAVYELYLLKKIHSDEIYNLRERAEYKEALENYYRFIGIFDVKPYCLEKNNEELIGCNIGDNEFSIEEKSQSLYNNIAVPKSEINKTRKMLIDLIKTNGKNSIKELNKLILSTIKIDEEFKKTLKLDNS